jgi:hypothetical protein
LKRRLETLKELNLGRCIEGSDVLPLNRVSSKSFTPNDLPAFLASYFMGYHMERTLLYTGALLIDGCTGFAIHRTEEGDFGHKLSSLAGIFTAELTALFVTLRHIGEVIQPTKTMLGFD